MGEWLQCGEGDKYDRMGEEKILVRIYEKVMRTQTISSLPKHIYTILKPMYAYTYNRN